MGDSGKQLAVTRHHKPKSRQTSARVFHLEIMYLRKNQAPIGSKTCRFHHPGESPAAARIAAFQALSFTLK
jgi:hypothetical protein